MKIVVDEKDLQKAIDDLARVSDVLERRNIAHGIVPKFKGIYAYSEWVAVDVNKIKNLLDNKGAQHE